ncbi:MAG: DNA-processing protein DprA [Candidatus Shapirobacteria bacterium]|nr:DNA-processing protein DprA [Candidatus Shapirobacteria bacterium]MDD4410612.1 DNA-processing protein DprA [Candidatus Shapirobacteria bacterium]
MNEWKKWPIKIIEKKDFPKGLKKISDCPEKLYYRGNWSDEIFENTLAIVGSRAMTRYGKEIISKFMPELIVQKITIISGFMYGVDSEAHRDCLDLGGKTIAVLGSGLNELYPSQNDKLYSEILEKNGLIISEYEPDFKATIWSFPQRNRIVSALSTIGVLIVEAGLKSGSLITAKLALKQKKRMFAVPGQIGSKTAEGTNWLIQSGGAKMATSVNDILGNSIHCPDQQNLFKDYSNLSDLEKQIVEVLENEEVTIDELCMKIRSPVSEISTTISMMLMRDLIVQENDKIYLS